MFHRAALIGADSNDLKDWIKLLPREFCGKNLKLSGSFRRRHRQDPTRRALEPSHFWVEMNSLNRERVKGYEFHLWG